MPCSAKAAQHTLEQTYIAPLVIDDLETGLKDIRWDDREIRSFLRALTVLVFGNIPAPRPEHA